MSHIGSFVPAESASVGPVDQFFSRVKSVESVSSGMSTFLQDSLQISRALNEATHSSLVIVDEFGKGTESVHTFVCFLSLPNVSNLGQSSWKLSW